MTTVPNSLIIEIDYYPFEKKDKEKFNPIIILKDYQSFNKTSQSLNNLHHESYL